MNHGNLDLTHTDQSVTLRLRHVVDGHPGAVLAKAEVPSLIRDLERAIAAPKVEDLLG